MRSLKLALALALMSMTASAEQQRRNPFQYVEPPAPKPKVVHKAPPAVEVVPQPPAAVVVEPDRPPRFPYHLIGRFGLDDDPIVAFTSDGKIVTVQRGDTIDGEFIIRSIGLETVEIGFVHHPATQRIQLDGWI